VNTLASRTSAKDSGSEYLVPRHASTHDGIWIITKDGDPTARNLFSRHYTYNKKRDQIRMLPEGRMAALRLFQGRFANP
jgi:hypothetical protein